VRESFSLQDSRFIPLAKTPFGTDPFWVPAHSLLWAAFTIALIGWVWLYIIQSSNAGALGLVSLIVILLGTSTASWIFSSDVTFVPIIARDSPELFKKIFTTGHVLTGALNVGLWIWAMWCSPHPSFEPRCFHDGPQGCLPLAACLFPSPTSLDGR
jgi:hypothetical protein